jgi:hypothetical protein
LQISRRSRERFTGSSASALDGGDETTSEWTVQIGAESTIVASAPVACQHGDVYMSDSQELTWPLPATHHSRILGGQLKTRH